MDASKSPKEVFSADIQKDLLLLEEQEGSVNFKFGVVYMKAGQKMDDEMLSNGEFEPEVCSLKFYSRPPRHLWNESETVRFDFLVMIEI